MMSKKGGIGVLVIIVVVAAIVFLQQGRVMPDGGMQTVRVAANLPITGPLAVWGTSIREGGQMALEDLKARDELAADIRIDWQDNRGEPSAAVSIFQQHFMRPPDLYVSGLKPQAMAIMDQVIARGIPNFVWIFDVAINQESSNNLRTLVNYKIEAPVYLEYIDRVRPRRISLVYIQLPHTLEQFGDIVIPAIRERRIELQLEVYDFGHQDFRDIAVKVRDFNPDLIILNGFQGHLVGLIRALRPMDLVRDGNVIATYDMIDAAKILAADELEGIRAVAPHFETRPQEGLAGEWRVRFRQRYGRAPLYIHAFAYDMVTVMNDAARRLALPADYAAWIEAVHATDSVGVTGPLRFDKDGDLLTPVEIGVFRNGVLAPDVTREQ